MFNRNRRSRGWHFIVKPSETMPGWQKLVCENPKIALARIFYHDKEIHLLGSVRDPHYHVYLSFYSPQTFDFVDSIVDNVCGHSLHSFYCFDTLIDY